MVRVRKDPVVVGLWMRIEEDTEDNQRNFFGGGWDDNDNYE